MHPHRHRRWTPEQDRRLIENYEAGELTVVQIAKGLGRSESSVHYRIKALCRTGRLKRREAAS